jgi:DNA-binding NarL/FixJ family response regulator
MALRQLDVLVVAEGEPLVARGLALVLEAQSWLSVGAAHDRAAARRALSERPVDVVVLFADEADAGLISWVRELHGEHPGIAYCLLVSSADLSALSALVAAGAGRIGVVLRADRLDGQEIVRTMRAAVMARASLERYQVQQLAARRDARAGRLRDLTEYEREVLRLMAVGLRNRVIARRLWKSENAVEKSVTQIFTKLGLDHDAASRLDRRVMAARIYLAEQAAERERAGRPALTLSEPR